MTPAPSLSDQDQNRSDCLKSFARGCLIGGSGITLVAGPMLIFGCLAQSLPKNKQARPLCFTMGAFVGAMTVACSFMLCASKGLSPDEEAQQTPNTNKPQYLQMS